MKRDKTIISLMNMEAGCCGVVDQIQGGYGLQSSLNAMGITRGKKITRIAPVFPRGPVTIEGEEIQRVVIGAGMASRVMVRLDGNVSDA